MKNAAWVRWSQYPVWAIVGLVLVGGGSLWAWAQAPAEAPEAAVERLSARTRDFLQDVSVGKAAEAYQRLLAGGPLVAETQAVAGLVQRTADLESRYGRCWNFERIAARAVGSDLLLLTFVYKCQQLPLVWRVAWYRTPGAAAGDDNWHVVSVRFDTEWERALP